MSRDDNDTARRRRGRDWRRQQRIEKDQKRIKSISKSYKLKKKELREDEGI